ncbi:MAG: hypothetical protein ACN23H_00815 [Candidatus Phytoplasma vitis]|nr:MAG: hypothetical protein M6G77_00690 [Candidatus Phytoplasma vitis]
MNLFTKIYNSTSSDNIVKLAFKAFDIVSDLFPAKFGVQITGKALKFTTKFAQGMSKTLFVFHEGHHIFNTINDMIKKTKEQ